MNVLCCFVCIFCTIVVQLRCKGVIIVDFQTCFCCVVDMAENSCTFRCPMCFFTDSSVDRFSKHMVRFHKHDPHFILNCGFQDCNFVSKSWPCFKMHVKRKHHRLCESANDNDGDNDDNNVDDYLPSVPVTKSLPPQNVVLSAAYLLSLETENKMTIKGVDTIVSSTSELLSSQFVNIKQQLEHKLANSGYNIPHEIFNDVLPANCFYGLESSCKRLKFYKEIFNLVEPRELYLGRTLVKQNGKVVNRQHFGVIIPFADSLKSLLSMPEVWHHIQTPKTAHDEVMRDVCDGYIWQEHKLFQQNPSALQIFLNTDDIECCNPVGCHVKKHKLTMFYYTLGNIPPQFRSKLTSIQLLAIAKTKDVRQFGVDVLLRDFLETLRKLGSGGIVMDLHGSHRVIEGALLLVLADTPAAHWLGGFKEGVGFARKACRCCDANEATMKSQFTASSFQQRSLAEHLKRCSEMSSLSNDAFKYWSCSWGINRKSCLCDIPHFNLIDSFVQDPLHLLLEGVVPHELKLFLHFCIFEAKYFTCDWLNVQLNSFQYTYLEADRPEQIQRTDLLCDRKLKQTSSAVLTLCKVLPYTLGVKLPSDCDRWLNFLRLLQITFLATCPFATVDTAGQLSQLITTHHTLFREHYPKAAITPKMHYLIHLPLQLLKFGPLRHHWCMRFEAKHAFFKSFKMKCFKNIPKTLANKHQLWMCHKQLGTLGSRNRNFLYEGDTVCEGDPKTFSEVYPGLFGEFSALVNSAGNDDCETILVYFTNSVKIQGFQYNIGCVIVTGYDYSGLPQFSVLRNIFVYKETKFFVLEQLNTIYFEHRMLCYVVNPCNTFSVLHFTDLSYPWPLSLHNINGQLCVINFCGHVCEFIM